MRDVSIFFNKRRPNRPLFLPRRQARAYDVAIRLLTAPFAPLDMSKIEMPTADPATVRFFVFAYGQLE